MKKKEIRYDVESDLGHENECDTKKEAIEEINESFLGKTFKIYKVTITRELVKTINKKRPRPCYGGWGKGHSTGFEYEKPKDGNYPKFIFCKKCGYLMKLTYRNFTDEYYILVTPRVHKDDELVCMKCGETFHPKKSLIAYLSHIGHCKVRKKK